MPTASGAVFLLLPLMSAVVFGFVSKRNPWRIRFTLRYVWLLWIAALFAAVRYGDPGFLPDWLSQNDGSVLLVLCWLAGAVFVLVNTRAQALPMRGFLLTLLAGFTLNVITIVVNAGRMPYSLPAAELAGYPAGALAEASLGHAPMTAEHSLTWLSDIIPVPYLVKVMSVGDLAMIIGLVGILVCAMPRRTKAAETVADGRAAKTDGPEGDFVS